MCYSLWYNAPTMDDDDDYDDDDDDDDGKVKVKQSRYRPGVTQRFPEI